MSDTLDKLKAELAAAKAANARLITALETAIAELEATQVAARQVTHGGRASGKTWRLLRDLKPGRAIFVVQNAPMRRYVEKMLREMGRSDVEVVTAQRLSYDYEVMAFGRDLNDVGVDHDLQLPEPAAEALKRLQARVRKASDDVAT